MKISTTDQWLIIIQIIMICCKAVRGADNDTLTTKVADDPSPKLNTSHVNETLPAEDISGNSSNTSSMNMETTHHNVKPETEQTSSLPTVPYSPSNEPETAGTSKPTVPVTTIFTSSTKVELPVTTTVKNAIPNNTQKLEDKPSCLPESLFWPTVVILVINLGIFAAHIRKTLCKQRKSVSMGIPMGAELRQQKCESSGMAVTYTALNATPAVKVSEDADVSAEKVESMNATEDEEKREKKGSVVVMTEATDSVITIEDVDRELLKDAEMIKKTSPSTDKLDFVIAIENGDYLKTPEILDEEKEAKKESLTPEKLDSMIAVENGGLTNCEPLKDEETSLLSMENSFDKMIAGDKKSKDLSVEEAKNNKE